MELLCIIYIFTGIPSYGWHFNESLQGRSGSDNEASMSKPPCQSLSSFSVKLQYPLILPQYFVCLSLYFFRIGKWSCKNKLKYIKSTRLIILCTITAFFRSSKFLKKCFKFRCTNIRENLSTGSDYLLAILSFCDDIFPSVISKFL